MSYDLETIIQAFAIACDECVDGTEGLEEGPAFLYILDFCRRHAGTLLADSAKELNERRDNALRS